MQNPNQTYSIKRLGPHIVLFYNEQPLSAPENLAKTFLQKILNKQHLDSIQFLGNRLRLNKFNNLSEPELHYLIGRYQKRYDSLSSIAISVEEKRLRKNRLTMKGSHETGCCFEHHCEIIRGKWQMELYSQEGEWLVVSVDVEGVDFE
jgi:hypothetical protein